MGRERQLGACWAGRRDWPGERDPGLHHPDRDHLGHQHLDRHRDRVPRGGHHRLGAGALLGSAVGRPTHRVCRLPTSGPRCGSRSQARPRWSAAGRSLARFWPPAFRCRLSGCEIRPAPGCPLDGCRLGGLLVPGNPGPGHLGRGSPAEKKLCRRPSPQPCNQRQVCRTGCPMGSSQWRLWDSAWFARARTSKGRRRGLPVAQGSR